MKSILVNFPMNIRKMLILLLLWGLQPVSAATLEKVAGWQWLSWKASEATESMQEIAKKAPLAGVGVDSKGRIYVSVPRWLDSRVPATLNRIVTIKGKKVLEPYPTAEMNDLSDIGALQNVLGFYIDSKQRMWVLDMGHVAGRDETPDGAQKIVVIDMRTGKTLRRFNISDQLSDRKKGFLNDISVDAEHDMAYISDSGIQSAPDNQTAIIVYDYKHNRARRVLANHPSTKNNPDVKLMVAGEPVFKDKPFQVGINGITVSADGKYVYWSKTTGLEFHRINTLVLNDFSSSAEQISAAVERLGQFGGNSDGILAGINGDIFITDLSNSRVVRYHPASKKFTTLVKDEHLVWPDSLDWGQSNSLYLTVNHLHHAFAGVIDYSSGIDNYEIWKIKLD